MWEEILLKARRLMNGQCLKYIHNIVKMYDFEREIKEYKEMCQNIGEALL